MDVQVDLVPGSEFSFAITYQLGGEPVDFTDYDVTFEYSDSRYKGFITNDNIILDVDDEAGAVNVQLLASAVDELINHDARFWRLRYFADDVFFSKVIVKGVVTYDG